jgi:hypothetical protein
MVAHTDAENGVDVLAKANEETEILEEDDDDDDVGPMPMPEEAGVVTKKRRGM